MRPPVFFPLPCGFYLNVCRDVDILAQYIHICTHVHVTIHIQREEKGDGRALQIYIRYVMYIT